MTAGSLRLPEKSVLLHIGPFKTGTTAIQGALFHARPVLEEHGVLHAGRDTQPLKAVLALRGVKPLVGDPTPRMEQWAQLVDQVTAAADKTVVVSSEFFADADANVAARAVHDLGAARVHVVVTLRALSKIMPSQWQQYVRNQATFSYEEWLDGMLNKPPYNRPTPTFWHRNRHDALVERWAAVVGPENVTVIVLDEADHGFLLRTFEELLGLPTGLLTQVRSSENRSLTLGEIELLREINFQFRRRRWSDQLYKQVVRKGIGSHMQQHRSPRADELRITTPQWALDKAAEIGSAAAERLSASGVRIVGDVTTLGSRSRAGEGEAAGDLQIAVDAAREAVVGAIIASGLLTPATLVDSSSTLDLARIILARGGRRVREETRRAKRRTHLSTRGGSSVPGPTAVIDSSSKDPMKRHDLLGELHRVYRPRTYLEVGVNDGRSLALSRAKSIAVDPAFKVTSPISCDVRLVKATSDRYFARPKAVDFFPRRQIDLAFIDGMHLFDFALRDLINIERFSAWTSVIVFDDMLPRNIDEAARDRHTGPWTGDVYKLAMVLEEHRPDLVCVVVDTQPTGQLLVFGADPRNRVLPNLYDSLVDRWVVPDPQDVPDRVLSRRDAVDPEEFLRAPFWRELVAARRRRRRPRGSWAAIRPKIQHAALAARRAPTAPPVG